MGTALFRRKYSAGTSLKECKEWRKYKFRTSASERLHSISRKSSEANEVSPLTAMWSHEFSNQFELEHGQNVFKFHLFWSANLKLTNQHR